MSNHKSPVQQSAVNNSLQNNSTQSGASMAPPAFDLSASPVQMAVEDEVGGLDHLRGENVDTTMSLGRGLADVDRNSPNPGDRLPFREDGSWDAETILTHLGQLDTIGIPQADLDAAAAAERSPSPTAMPATDNSTTTDSDNIRCVQAVSLAARILQGPVWVRSLFGSVVVTAMLGGHHNERAQTAAAVLGNVGEKIENQTATYGDLSWAQEAMHDMFYDDASGTPMDQVVDQINPTLDFTGNTTSSNDWYANSADALTAANALQAGQQMIATIFTVGVNHKLDETDPADQRIISRRGLPATGKPDGGDLDDTYDTFRGHQLLVIKMPDGNIRVYDPEQTSGGTHFGDTSSADVGMANQFHDQPDFDMYKYLNVMGLRTPMTF